jgi:hypothetical protein
MKNLFFWAALLVLLPIASNAAQVSSVEVLHTGNDSVGQAIAFYLKEALRASQSFELINDSRSPRIVVHVVTVDTDDPNRGVSSSIATSVVYDSLDVPLQGLFLSAQVQYCGRSRVESCEKPPWCLWIKR